MRYTYFIIVLAFLAISSLYAFNVSDYLLDNESNQTIKQDNFTYNGKTYELFYINDSLYPNLIVSDEQVVKEEKDIREVLYNFYVERYYPKNLSDIKNVILINIDYFNKSRKDGTAEEEFGCRRTLGENLPDPQDPKGFPSVYHRYAVVVCSLYAAAIGCNDYNTVLPHIQDFFTNSYNIDAKIGLIKQSLSVSDPLLIGTAYTQAFEALKSINDSVNKLKQNRLRFPRDDNTGEVKVSECPNCYAICDELVVNKTAFKTIENTLSEVVNKTRPLRDFDKAFNYTLNSTSIRVENLENRNLRITYSAQLEDITKGWDFLKNRTRAVLSKVDDKNLSSAIAFVDELKQNISDNIKNNNFTDIKANLNRIKSNIDYISTKTKDYEQKLKLLNEEMAKAEALYISYINEIDDPLLKQTLIDKRQNLKDSTSSKIQPSSLDFFKNEYSNISSSILSFMANKKQSYLAFISNAFINYFNALYDPISNFMPLNPEQKTSLMNTLSIVYAVSVGLAFSSFLFWIAIAGFYAPVNPVRKESRKGKIYFIIILALICLIIFSVTTIWAYFVYDKALNKGSIIDFKNYIRQDLEKFVIVKSSKALTCGKEIASVLNATVLEYRDNKCYMNDNTKPLETCYRAMTKANAVVIDLKEPASVYSRYLGEPLLYLSLSESDLNTCFVKAALE